MRHAQGCRIRPAGWFLLFLAAGGCVTLTGCEPGATGTKRDRDQGRDPVSQPSPRGPTSTPRVEPEPPPPSRSSVWPARAIWVPRAAYRSPEEIVGVMDRCCRAGFNTVLFQVRGEGTAYYGSNIEPRAYTATFDPLVIACREAHRRGMALHAWVNVMPAWKGSSPPRDPKQLYNAHPDWFWYDQHGKRQPLADFYVSLNPCLPEVRHYLVGVMREIVTRYPVDGLHLDYIRMPMDEAKRGTDYPYDARTLSLYRKASGKRPQDGTAAWSKWRTEQVTQVVRDIRSMTQQARPGLMLTAACGPDLNEFRSRFFQDGPGWLRAGLLDAVFVMNYNSKTANFRKRQDEWFRAAGGKMVAAGVGEYLHNDPAVTAEQLRLARQWGKGFAVFSYTSLLANEARAAQRLPALRGLIGK